ARPKRPWRYRQAVALVVVALAGVVPAAVLDHDRTGTHGGLSVGSAPAPVRTGAADVPLRPGVRATGSGYPGPPRDGRGCGVGAKLVPTCDILWGAAAGGFSQTPRTEAVRSWETSSGRPVAIYHGYHRGDEAFPTPAEVAMAHDPHQPRLL